MSPDELDAIRWRQAHTRKEHAIGDRSALLELVDELLLREQRVIGLLDSWHKDEHELQGMAEFGPATTLHDCQDDLRSALWPRVTT